MNHCFVICGQHLVRTFTNYTLLIIINFIHKFEEKKLNNNHNKTMEHKKYNGSRFTVALKKIKM